MTADTPIDDLKIQLEQQAAELADLKRRLDLAITWARTHHRAKERAEKALERNVAQAIRGCARLARDWPKEHLPDFYPGNEKPGKETLKLVALVANGIATRIEKELRD